MLYLIKLSIKFGPDQNNTELFGGIWVKVVAAPLVGAFAGGNVRLTGKIKVTISFYLLLYYCEIVYYLTYKCKKKSRTRARSATLKIELKQI
jgi:hypothetical protein